MLNYKAVNFVLFQAGWFAVVLSVANQLELVAILVVAGILVTHIYNVKDRVAEFMLISVAALTGFIVDSLLIASGVFQTSGNLGFNNMAPLWLIMLWMLFSITINHSLSWLQQKYLLAAVLGFVFAPLAYFAGNRFDVLSFPPGFSTYSALFIIAVAWAVVTPLLIYISTVTSARSLNLAN